MTIELIDKVIKIPAGEDVLVSTEDNPKTVIIKIPRKLLTTKLSDSQVFILTQVNEQEPKVQELTYLTDTVYYAYYQWKITREHTSEEGKLIIQIKILKEIKDMDIAAEEVDPEFSIPIGLDEDGTWISYQNQLKILKVLKPLL